jgi:hypothetical protein
MNAQQDDDFYTSRSHFVIRNAGDMTDVRVTVMEMLASIGVPLPGEAP